MKMMKRLMLVMLAVMMLLTCTVAQADVSLTLQKAMVTDAGQIQIVMHTAQDLSQENTSVEVLLDAQPLTVDSIDAYGKSDTSWIILHDEGAVGAGDSVKELLNQLIDKFYDQNSNFAIINTSSEEIALSDDLSALRAVIESDVLKHNSSKNNLNEAIVKVVDFLETNNTVKNRANLVIISSGKRAEKGQSTTDAKVQEALKASDVTVYAVAYDNKSPNADYNALAQSSKAGMSLYLAKQSGDNAKKAAAETLASIEENEQQIQVLTVTPTQVGKTLSVKLSSDTASRTVTLDLTAEQQNALSAALTAAVVPVDPEVTAESEPTAEPESEPTATPFPGPFEPITWTMVYIGGGALALILVVTIILLVVKGKKKAVVEEITPSVDPSLDNVAMPQPVVEAFEPTVPNVVPMATGIRVTLSQVGMNEQQIYTSDMQDTLIIGRDPAKARMIIAPSDHKISGAHLRLNYQGGVMYAQNMGRNGTMVNGVTITAPTVLHENDRLTMGTTTLLISWQRIG